MIARDEDLSSPDEPELTTTAPRKSAGKPTTVHSSESEGEAPAILTPVRAYVPQKSPPKKSASRPLRSALDIELTESEEEEDNPVEDEDIDGSSKKKSTVAKSQSNGRGTKFDDIFEPSPSAERKKPNTGLMLQFSTTSAPKPPVASKDTSLPAKGSTPTEESSDRRKKEKQKKKSKKSRQSKEEEDSPSKKGGGDQVVTGNGNPYGVIASLDAWLNSDSNALVRESSIL